MTPSVLIMARRTENCKWVWRVPDYVLLYFHNLHWYLFHLVPEWTAGFWVRDCYGWL